MQGTEQVRALKIKSIRLIGQQDVYNMEVDGFHNFCINGGLVVHNCYDAVGYGLIAYHKKQSKPLPEEKTVMQQDKERIARHFNRKSRRLT